DARQHLASKRGARKLQPEVICYSRSQKTRPRHPRGLNYHVATSTCHKNAYKCSLVYNERIASGDSRAHWCQPSILASAKQPALKSITTLAVDVGGTGIKAAALDEKGKMITERQKIKTPRNATPKKVIAIIAELAKMAGAFDRASVGFPGVIKNGVVYTAPNLGKGWNNFPLEAALKKKLKRPVRIANDADVQGLG